MWTKMRPHTKTDKLREACRVDLTNPETKVTTQGGLNKKFIVSTHNPGI